jgi:fatty-acid desaturase
VGALAALFFFSWQRLVVMLVLYVVAINVGIGMCYHRLLTHRGYQVPKWLEYTMAVCATLALEGGPIFWVATHRVHHQHSDQDGDPHTPREGGWWAHTGWILWGNTLHMQTEVLGRYTPDLAKDRFMVWLSKWHWIPLVQPAACCSSAWAGFRRDYLRIGMLAVGRIHARNARPARHLVCELRHAPLGHAAALKPATTRATTGGWPW